MRFRPSKRRPRTVMLVTWSLVAGGAETYALSIASNLDRRRYRPVLCAIDKGGALEADVTRLALPYRIMHRPDRLDPRLMWRMYQLFRSMRVDVVHTHHFNQLFYSLLPAKLLGLRVIHTEHSVECYKRRRLRVALRVLAMGCDTIIAVGADAARTLRRRVGLPRHKLRIIGGAVNVASFNVSREEARAALNLDGHARVAAIVARLFPEKNHLLLLDAFARVVARVPQARLLIAGDGVCREPIVARIADLGLGDSVRLLGVRRDIPDILAASDLFVLCSDREALPIAVLEAMAAGRAVVATRVGDLPRVVRHQTTGLLVPARDPIALAEAIAQLLADPDTCARMGDAAREMVRQYFTVTDMVARYERLYAQHQPLGS